MLDVSRGYIVSIMVLITNMTNWRIIALGLAGATPCCAPATGTSDHPGTSPPLLDELSDQVDVLVALLVVLEKALQDRLPRPLIGVRVVL